MTLSRPYPVEVERRGMAELLPGGVLWGAS